MNGINFQIYSQVKNYILSGRKSIAMSVVPGMGLTTMLSNLALDIEEKTLVRIEVTDILDIWNNINANPEEGRYLLHLATIKVLQKVMSEIQNSTTQNNSSNLVTYLDETRFSYDTYVMIDEFEKLPDDVAVIILDEIKFFEDNRSQEAYKSLKKIHYIIGGYIDFGSLYRGRYRRGVSSATNFEKYNPSEFLLSSVETTKFLGTYFPDIERDRLLSLFVQEWCGGYLHYIMEMSKWILSEISSNGYSSIQHLMLKLKKIIEANREIPLFKYCNQGWSQFTNDKASVNLLAIAISSGYVICSGYEARSLARQGYLIQRDFNVEDEFFIPNKIIELFVRQRLAELELVMPLDEGGVWVLRELNMQAYSLLVEMENQLRSYIGDKLVYSLNSYSIEDVFDQLLEEVEDDQKRRVIEKIKRKAYWRMHEEDLVMNTLIKDCILSYLDFSDLGEILILKKDIFPNKLSELLSNAIARVTFFRNRIAHNRPLSKSQIDILREEWCNMQKIMAMRNMEK